MFTILGYGYFPEGLEKCAIRTKQGVKDMHKSHKRERASIDGDSAKGEGKIPGMLQCMLGNELISHISYPKLPLI